MKRSQIQAMSSLSRANPMEQALQWWTPSEEDALLAMVFSTGSQPSPEVGTSVPSGPQQRVKRAVLIGLSIVVAGTIALVVDLVGSDSPTAFAAWTTSTTTPPASQLKAAQSACESFYEKGTRLTPAVTSGELASSLPPVVLIDSRGPYEMLVYAGTTGEGVCLWDSSGGVVSVGASNGETLPATSDLSIGAPGVGFDTVRRSVLTYAYGHAGTSVTGVSLQLANGLEVQATVHNGFYAAWWPSQTDVTTAKVTTSKGIHNQNFCDIGPNNNGPPEPISSCVGS